MQIRLTINFFYTKKELLTSSFALNLQELKQIALKNGFEDVIIV